MLGRRNVNHNWSLTILSLMRGHGNPERTDLPACSFLNCSALLLRCLLPRRVPVNQQMGCAIRNEAGGDAAVGPGAGSRAPMCAQNHQIDLFSCANDPDDSAPSAGEYIGLHRQYPAAGRNG